VQNEKRGQVEYFLTMTLHNIKEIEKAIGYRFGNKRLLETAFTTPAYANQQKSKGETLESGDRLEFLGDAVLKYIVTHRLYMSGNFTADQMTKDRQTYERFETHAGIVDCLGLAQYLSLVGNQGVSEKMKSDLFESIIGAVYLDKRGGLKEARRLISRFMFSDNEK